MSKENLPFNPEDPFGIRKKDFSIRKPEKHEMFNTEEAQRYIDNCDYPETADYFLLALETQRRLGEKRIPEMKIMESMCGPGRLGREFLALGAKRVVFHDGSMHMLSHAKKKALEALQPGQSAGAFLSEVDTMPIRDNVFDLVICHNSTHQLSSIDKLRETIREFLRVTAPGGHVIIADFQRNTTPEFIDALEKRLEVTREGVRDLLVDSFFAAFSKAEFIEVICGIEGVQKWEVIDAPKPILTPVQRARVDQDFIKGHEMDFSPISQRIIIQKK